MAGLFLLMGSNSQILRRPQDDSEKGVVISRPPSPSLSSYVCTPLFKRQNSQILRRPQDDSKKGVLSSQSSSRWLSSSGLPPIFVILRPPKDRAVLYSPKSKKKKEVCKQKTLPFWKGFEII
jgi:hypothetical protein